MANKNAPPTPRGARCAAALALAAVLLVTAGCGQGAGSPASPGTQGTQSAPAAGEAGQGASAAGAAQSQSASQNAQAAAAVDLDLTAMSKTMVYSQVYNMVNAPQDYNGVSVKMSGPFELYYANPENELGVEYYFAVIIEDALACCQQGMEFIWEGASYPQDYPEPGQTITVTGVFEVYEDGGYPYGRVRAQSVAFAP